uniref:Uncharacterized protein n=1 Tax=Lepeophtheirus salmonis TaxID=72036 RepID=A0A0K2V971_LEPSM
MSKYFSYQAVFNDTLN